MPNPLPTSITTPDELDELLSRPTAGVLNVLRTVPGDVMLLGVAGKMGPTLARMLRRACDQLGDTRAIIGVARFSDPAVRQRLDAWGIKTYPCDLLDPAQLAKAPDAPNIIYMPAMKFGATGQEPRTWAINALLPGMVCQRFSESRMVAFSTGNVYGMVPLTSGGSVETASPHPVGEYAMSCLGRERIFEHSSLSAGTPVAIERLNYAVEMRYGVLRDIADRIWQQTPIDLCMGFVNVIWQGDANARTIQLLQHAASPPFVLNVTGPETLAVRDVAEQIGRLLDRQPQYTGEPAPDSLLASADRSIELFGPPAVDVPTLLRWTAEWVRQGGESLGKPTHFQSRDGRF